jgi:hypothetical protein
MVRWRATPVVSPVEPVPQRRSSILSVGFCSNKTVGTTTLQENAETAEVDKLVRRPASVLSAAPVQTNRRKIGFTGAAEETEKMSEGEDASLCFLCALLFKNKPSEDWVYKSSGGSRGPAKLDT